MPGDTAKTRAAYQDLLMRRKNAHPELLVLMAAYSEYHRYKSSNSTFRIVQPCIVLADTGSMPRQLASNEHLDYIAALLDDIFRIPGTQIRFGLDALIGWVPGIGDALAGIASFLIVFAAWRRGVQAITLVRMMANVLLETTLGAIPVAGDVFHVFWKANRRNYRLLIREKEEPGANTRRDWMFLAIILFTVIAAAGIPIAILIWILRSHSS